MSDVPTHILDWRRKTGADRWDEVWEGVLHMAPNPTRSHQHLEAELHHWLRRYWTSAPDRAVYLDVNVSRPGIDDWNKDYRVPDLVLLTGERARREWEEHFVGGPDVVVEIRSPGDETYDKLGFYAAIGVREIWVVDRDSCACEVYEVVDAEPQRRKANVDGWTPSAIGIELRTEDRRLALRLTDDHSSVGRVP